MKACTKCGASGFPDEANFCPACAGRLAPADEAPIAAGAPAPIASPVTSGLDPRFVLGGQLADTARSVHFEASDQQTQSACWIEFYKPAVVGDPQTGQRVEHECKQLAQLAHPGIAKVLGHGWRGQEFWIAYERPTGRNLGELVATSGAMPISLATTVIAQIGEALEEAAKLGVVHRDLAPENIFFDGSQAKVTNFSVAFPGATPGVAEFLAPEQIQGQSLDPRASIYNLAALYYFVLTGRPPFTGSPQQVAEQHLSAVPQNPSTFVPLTPEIDALVLKALEKASSKRFMTLRQFVDEVLQHKDAQPMAQADEKANVGSKTMIGGFSVDSVDAGEPSTAPQPAGTDAGEAEPTPAAPPQAATEAAQPAPAAATQVQGQAVADVAGATGKGRRRGASPERKNDRKKKQGFRETMWFKKGDLDAAAAEKAASKDPKKGLPAMDKADEMPIEDRYSDDGSISDVDKQAYSLQTGHTQAMPVMEIPETVAASNVSADDLIGEMKAGRGKVIAALVIGLVVIVGLVVLLAAGGGGDDKKPGEGGDKAGDTTTGDTKAGDPKGAADTKPTPK